MQHVVKFYQTRFSHGPAEFLSQEVLAIHSLQNTDVGKELQ